jgi:cation-transporting ATPase 13A1
MLITTFVVNYKGRPYMEPLSSNRGLAAALAAAALLILALAAGAIPDLASYLELVPLHDSSLRAELQLLLAGDFAACWLLERAVSRIFRY